MENILRDVRIYFMVHDYTAGPPNSSRKIKKIIIATNPAAAMQRAAQDGKACRQNFAGLIFCFFRRLEGV